MMSKLYCLIRLDDLIYHKNTGTPTHLAWKIGISQRSLFEYLRVLRDMGAPIEYSRKRRTYYYRYEGRFLICFVSKSRKRKRR